MGATGRAAATKPSVGKARRDAGAVGGGESAGKRGRASHASPRIDPAAGSTAGRKAGRREGARRRARSRTDAMAGGEARRVTE